MFVTSGINDPRVTYWEPAKWVAKLRAMKTDNNVVLLLTNMKAGHAGNAGRFGYSRDIAKEHNFVFKVFGLKVKKGEF
jgi:oligopeptidase B